MALGPGKVLETHHSPIFGRQPADDVLTWRRVGYGVENSEQLSEFSC
jgi:hypothetical protein